MKIERVSKQTAPAAGHIYALSWKTGYKDLILGDYLDKLSSDNWTKRFENSVYKDFILEDNGKYVAASSVAPARDENMRGWGEIVSIYVLPEYFRCGYGKILFNHDVAQLKEDGYTNIYLWVLEENHRARNFYKAMGFAPNGDRSEIIIGGKKLTEVRYVNKQ